VSLGSPSGGALLPTYLVEAYTPPSRANQADTADRLARAAAALGCEGIQVEHRRTTFLADDDTSFYLVEAPSPTAVSELCRRAGLGRVRIVRAVET
jgi:hypothetical protein